MRMYIVNTFLGIFFGSCVFFCSKPSKNELDSDNELSSEIDLAAVSLLFEESFESASPLVHPLIMDQKKATTHARTYVSSPAFRGKKSARFELRDSDPEISKGTRSEIAFFPADSSDRWYSFAVYFPKAYWEKDTDPEIITQWHGFPDEDLNEEWGSPATKMLIVNDSIRFDVGYNPKRVSRKFKTETHYNLGVVPKNKWQEFIIHINHSYKSDGLVEVWQNGKKVVEHKGGNCYNDAKLPFWKLGIYKWGWNGENTTDVKKRVLYIDNIRVGGGKSSYQAMSAD